MRHALEAIVHADNAEAPLPEIQGLRPGPLGIFLPRTENAMNILREMTDIAMEELRRNNPGHIALVHPLDRHQVTPMFTAIAAAIQAAATANAFGETPPNISMRWYCTNENPMPVTTREVYTNTDNQFVAYCTAHALEEAVELREVTEEEEEEEEEEIYTPAPNSRVRLNRLAPEWWFLRLRNDGYNVNTGITGTVLWSDNVYEHTGADATPASFVSWEGTGWEFAVPNSSLRPAT